MTKDKTRLLHVPRFRTLACLAGIALATGLRAAPLTTAAELAAVNRGENTEAAAQPSSLKRSSATSSFSIHDGAMSQVSLPEKVVERND